MRTFNTPSILVMLLTAVALLPACSTVSPLSGSENVITKEMAFSDFTSIDISSAFEVEIIQSDTYSIIITAADNLFDNLKVRQQDDTLKIYMDPFYSNITSTKKAKITLPELNKLNLSHKTSGTVNGFHSSDDFNLTLSTGSKLSGDLEAGISEFVISSGSSITLEGSADNITIDASSVSTANLEDFTVNNATVNLSSGSRATLNATGQLDVELSSGSTLHYLGDPTIGNISISSGSTMKPKE